VCLLHGLAAEAIKAVEGIEKSHRSAIWAMDGAGRPMASGGEPIAAILRKRGGAAFSQGSRHQMQWLYILSALELGPELLRPFQRMALISS
jgi:hypothetical protein